MRHVQACSNVVLPGERVTFRIGGVVVGWLRPDMLDDLAAFPGLDFAPEAVALRRPETLEDIARALAERGWYRWRREAFDVRETPGGPVLARLDRGAIPSFGTLALGVHVNGLVRDGGDLRLWVARRARDKLLDPGKLDHIVAGGVPSGLSVFGTLVKEAAEEAAIPAPIAMQARAAGRIGYAMLREEGLRRDVLYAYDLDLDPSFEPQAADGEVEAFELWPMRRVMEAVRDSDEFKFNVNLVLIDLFLRLGLLAGAEAAALRAALTAAEQAGIAGTAA